MSPHGILVHRDYDAGLVKVKVLKVKFANLGENQAHVNYGWNVNNGRYSRVKDGTPVWDNSNWLKDVSNPFEVTKSLDIEFENLSQSHESKLQF